MRVKRVGGAALASILVAAGLVSGVQAANPSNIIPYTGGYDEETYPSQRLTSLFTVENIIVDGVADSAYENSQGVMIDNLTALNGYTYPEGKETYGVIKSVWDGPVLYLYAEIYDSTISRGGPEDTGGASGNPAVPETQDSVSFGLDLYNDKVLYETDTIGVFTIGSNGALYYYRNSGIPSLGSVMADPTHPEYQNRIKGYATSEILDENGQAAGYAVELAVQIEGLDLQNGTEIGVEVEISDVADGKRVGNIFWSHGQESLYTDLNHEHPNAVDWGTVTIDGWNGTDEFAYSEWRLTNAIRYLDSASFPKDVYTVESQAELDAARSEAEQVLARSAQGTEDREKADAAAERLESAITGLRWADTRYPDPDTLPDQMTLPNPYQFFQSERIVESREEWEERREEILDLAQFYEYGYKPEAPDKMEISAIEHFNVGDTRTVLMWGFWPMEVTVSCPTDVVTLDITVGDTTASMEFTVYSPTEEQLQASGHTDGPVPVVLSYDGDNEVYRNAGFAVVEVPIGSGGDVRTDEYAWGTRTGIFYTLYPYSRNGEGALKEVSSEMAAAWSATRVIDALENIGECTLEYASGIADVIDPERLAVTGFSINGKYAFVAAVFDERIDVCIPGAAGATGPSPWRYVYTGHEYDWTGTLFEAAEDSGVSSQQTASGTEMMANSIRHNRVRETELFRQFLNPGNFYERLPGAYGYGTRLPYDQNDLIATLAPRAIVLENTVNDYNDGCEADSLGLQIAKSVYRTLGYDADDLVKFNQRPVQPGEPHGTDDAQKSRTAEYLNYYFYGEPMSEETDTWLNTDPFNLPVSNEQSQSPYDYYYGGFNTITGGTGGVDGRDGWYYYTFPEEVTMADTSELQNLYDSLAEKDLSIYTEETAEALRDALTNALSVLQMGLEDTEESRAVISDATEALRQADAGLKETETVAPPETDDPADETDGKPSVDPGEPGTAKPGDATDNTEPGDSTQKDSQKDSRNPQNIQSVKQDNKGETAPDTGDSSNAVLWSSLIICTGIVIAGIITVKRRK